MRDMHYELDLFHRMEGARVNGMLLTELELYGDKALWQRFHQAVFDGDIKRFARTRSFSHLVQEEKRFKQPLRGVVVVIAATTLNLLAFFISILRRPRVLVFQSIRRAIKKHTLTFVFEVSIKHFLKIIFHTLNVSIRS